MMGEQRSKLPQSSDSLRRHLINMCRTATKESLSEQSELKDLSSLRLFLQGSKPETAYG